MVPGPPTRVPTEPTSLPKGTNGNEPTPNEIPTLDRVHMPSLGTPERATSSLTPNETPTAVRTGVTGMAEIAPEHNTPVSISSPTVFQSNEDRRRRVQGDKPIMPERDWHSTRDGEVNIQPQFSGSDIVNTNPISWMSHYSSYPEEEIVENEFDIAEFGSQRSVSPNNMRTDRDDQRSMIPDNNQHDGSENEEGYKYNPDEESLDNVTDGKILNADHIVYRMALSENGPWALSKEEELSVQLFLNDLSDHQQAVTCVLAHR